MSILRPHVGGGSCNFSGFSFPSDYTREKWFAIRWATKVFRVYVVIGCAILASKRIYQLQNGGFNAMGVQRANLDVFLMSGRLVLTAFLHAHR
jgi:hypothetical protein